MTTWLILIACQVPLFGILLLLKKLFWCKQMVFEKGSKKTCTIKLFEYEVQNIPTGGVGFCGYNKRYASTYKSDGDIYLIRTTYAHKFFGIIVERSEQGCILYASPSFLKENGVSDSNLEPVFKIIIVSPVALWIKAIKYRKRLKKSIQIAKDNLLIKDIIE